MSENASSRPFALVILVILLVLLAGGGVYGGVMFLLDPSGALLGTPTELLDNVPLVNDYFLPGLFLIFVMGLAPLAITYGIKKRLPWAWKAALAQGIVLFLWICFQILLWGAPAAIQIIYLVWGLLIVGLCILPGVKQAIEPE